MSFLSIIKTIASTVLGVEKLVSPVVGVLVPGAQPVVNILDSIVTRVQNAIVTVEANNPVGNGTVKFDAVVADFQAAVDLAQSMAAAAGKTLTYDKAALTDAINDQVAAYNAFAKLKASFQFVDAPKA